MCFIIKLFTDMVNIFLYKKIGGKLIYNVFYKHIIYRHGKYVSIQKNKSCFIIKLFIDMVNMFLYKRIGEKLIYNMFYNLIIYTHGKYVSIQKDKSK